MVRKLSALILLILLLTPLTAASPFGNASIGAHGGYLSVDSIPEWSYGFDMEFRMGADINETVGFYGGVSAGFALPLMPLHRFLELPGLFDYGVMAGAMFRTGRWTFALEGGVRSYLVSGQQTLMYGGSFIPSFAFLTASDLGFRNQEARSGYLPLAYMISLPISAYASPDGLDLRVGVAVSIDIDAAWRSM